MAHQGYRWRIGVFSVLTCLATAVARFSLAVREFGRVLTEFMVWGISRTFPETVPITEAKLYEVGRARAVAYAERRRDGFDPRHVDQGWLAAA